MAKDWQEEARERKARVAKFLAEHELSIESTFVPWMQSRNRDGKEPTLNWRVTLLYKGRKVIETDYSAGCAHCPSYELRTYDKVDGRAAVIAECMEGRSKNPKKAGYNKPILPDAADVIYSLCSDARVIECGGFEPFAAEYGYDVDSRKAEKLYRTCVDIGLKMRAELGQPLLVELQELYADW
jgi:hypothetical protein